MGNEEGHTDHQPRTEGKKHHVPHNDMGAEYGKDHNPKHETHGHEEHKDHSRHQGHGNHHAHMVKDFKKRFWIF